ncbi:type IV pilus modification protein PilV [Psychromonas marina]|uniref:Type IV pilus modification protein PilV n=1 Tax=Psychromonas marina TaxID=88364 RepID=A0ABQ6E621_9GAMM|nr:type IV pilus modification protein PilV [Psychromonas marina]GLS92595.1 type IV pilus modification protein PilV [Psychromonas marina]
MYNNEVGRREQKGSSLIEILVAVFILAAGLLGLASVQMLSLKNINNAQFHTLATTYAYDMGERMRSNQEAVSLGSYDNILSTVADPSCSTCSAAQMAQLDGFQWNELIQSAVNQGGLPEGQGTVTKVGSVFNITVSWKEQQRSDSGGDIGDASFTLTIQI